MRIPFNKASLTGQEIDYILQSVAEGHISGDGPFSARCEQFLEQMLDAPKVLLTTSCSDALELAALLVDLEPGDEVILPSFTFVSTANAFALRGAKPVFADIRPDTLNIDDRALESLITPRTRAIVPVHYAGVGCEMDAILEIASRNSIHIVEDNAHGLCGRYRGRMLGTFGCIATQSFHETKNFTCGEGGALVVNDPRLIERAEILRDKGTNRGKYFRGQVDKYTWVDLGSSFLPSDILAAFLLAQIERHDRVQARRRRLWELYFDGLSDWARNVGARLPFVPQDCEQPYHMFYLIMPSLQKRQELISHLARHGIQAVFHYVPLHDSEMGRKFGGFSGQCPVAEGISECLIRLPYYNSLSEYEQEYVIETIVAQSR